MGRALNWSVAVGLVAVGAYFYLRPDPIAQLDVHGSWEPRYEAVADIFRQNLRNGFMRGASFAACVDGKLVVDLWGGYTDEEFKLQWQENTITHIASTTKFVTALAFSTLIDKGYVNYDDLVSKHWPEFAQNGKENVTVNMLISHQAGVPYLDDVVSFKDFVDNPTKAEKILAKQKPKWSPGTAIGYHGLTVGMYVDILARKVDPKHRPIYQIYDEELRIPLGLDLFIATPLSQQYRFARIHQATAPEIVRSFVKMPSFRKFLFSLITGNPDFSNILNGIIMDEMQHLFSRPDLRAVPVPAASGAGTARSLAKLAGLVAARTPVNGKPLLSNRVVNALNAPSMNGEERLMRFNATVGHGTFIFKNPQGDNVFGHHGAGGQMGYSDPKNKVGLAFITNYFAPFTINDDLRFVPLEKAFYECLSA